MKLVNLVGKVPVHTSRKPRVRKFSSITGIVFHCSDIDIDAYKVAEHAVKPGKQNHITERGCPTAPYHDYIYEDGTIHHLVDYNHIVYHAGGFNSKTIAVSMRYVATKNRLPPPQVQLQAALDWMTHLALVVEILPRNIKGHRELPGTGYIYDNKGKPRLLKTCPGLLVNLNNTRYTIAIQMQQILKAEGLYNGQLDGKFGPQSIRALKIRNSLYW